MFLLRAQTNILHDIEHRNIQWMIKLERERERKHNQNEKQIFDVLSAYFSFIRNM